MWEIWKYKNFKYFSFLWNLYHIEGEESLFSMYQIRVLKLILGKSSNSMVEFSKGTFFSLLLGTREGHVFLQSNFLMLVWGGMGSGIWLVLASGLCLDVINITSRWKHLLSGANFSSSSVLILEACLTRVSTRWKKLELLGHYSKQLPQTSVFYCVKLLSVNVRNVQTCKNFYEFEPN